MYCKHCDKDVVCVSISRGAASEADIDQIRQTHKQKGRLVLFNPPPFDPYYCPRCRRELQLERES